MHLIFLHVYKKDKDISTSTVKQVYRWYQ